MVQVLPFQLSANVTSAPVAPEAPTAVQLVGAVHVTPERLLFCAPAGAGVVWIFQLVPFQRSANAVSRPLLLKCPVAVQAVPEAHDTPERMLSPIAVGLGVGWVVHLEPFQRSANGTDTKLLLLLEAPTAVQDAVEVHDTPARELLMGAGFGVGWIVQPVPFQLSANVARAPLPASEYPTATQSVFEVHETPVRTVF